MDKAIQDFCQVIDGYKDSEGRTTGRTTAGAIDTTASGYMEVPQNGAVLGHPNNTERRLTDEEAEKALKKLKKRQKLSKFRQIKSLDKVRIGDTVRSTTGFPMQVTGIFQDFPNEDRGTLYLDFDGNEGDIWEEALCDVEWCGSWLSVILKKLFR